MMKTSAIVFSGVNRVEIAHVQIPDPADDELVIETLFTCISPGTECRILGARQDAEVSFPLIPGYANVGRVIGHGHLATMAEGTLVFSGGTSRVTGCGRMWGGHVAHGVFPESKVVAICPGVDAIEASAMKLSAISLHGSRVAPCLPGDHVLVVGLGPIGQLSARHYKSAGATVLGADVNPWRVELAKKAGITAITVPAAEGLSAALLGKWPDGADILVDCTGAPPVVSELVRLARDLPWDDRPAPHRQTTYVFQGSYASKIAISYWEAFMKEMRFILPRDHQPQDLRIAMERLASGTVRLRDLISDVRRPADAARAYAELQDSRHNLMTLVFDWRAQAGH